MTMTSRAAGTRARDPDREGGSRMGYYLCAVLGGMIGFMTAALLQAGGRDEPENREEEERE